MVTGGCSMGAGGGGERWPGALVWEGTGMSTGDAGRRGCLAVGPTKAQAAGQGVGSQHSSYGTADPAGPPLAQPGSADAATREVAFATAACSADLAGDSLPTRGRYRRWGAAWATARWLAPRRLGGTLGGGWRAIDSRGGGRGGGNSHWRSPPTRRGARGGKRGCEDEEEEGGRGLSCLVGDRRERTGKAAGGRFESPRPWGRRATRGGCGALPPALLRGMCISVRTSCVGCPSKGCKT